RIMGLVTYYNVRRPYDIYTADGRLLRADVDNQGGRSGEEPRTVPLAPGRYSSPRCTVRHTGRCKSRFAPARGPTCRRTFCTKGLGSSQTEGDSPRSGDRGRMKRGICTL